MKILVTGSSGLIGSATCPILEQQGFDIIKLDIRSEPKKLKKPDFGNLLNQKELSRAMEGVEGIIHLAAVSRVIDAERNPQLCFETNVKGFKNLLTHAMRMSKKPWILFASSREIYGEPEFFPVNEEHSLQPINYYGKCKLAAETMLQEAESEGISSVVLRLSNVYGSVYDYPTRVIPAFLTGALKQTPLRLDFPEHIFDFTHVNDVAAGIVKATHALSLEQIGRSTTFNLSPGKGTSLIQLINYIGKITGKSVQTIAGEKRKYDVSHYVGDSTKIRNKLGFKCKIDIEEGLKLLHSEYLEVLGGN